MAIVSEYRRQSIPTTSSRMSPRKQDGRWNYEIDGPFKKVGDEFMSSCVYTHIYIYIHLKRKRIAEHEIVVRPHQVGRKKPKTISCSTLQTSTRWAMDMS